MNVLEVLENKKNNHSLSTEEINFFIDKYAKKEIADYQASALMMAICLNGMTDKETVDLTRAMINSGDILDYGFENKILVDKHSTGGVGDKTSLVLIPLLASIGFIVPKLSGRGLGYTGGTIDKLESIPGFSANMSEKELKKQLEDIGCAIIESGEKLVPVDKMLYSLRDVTATVDSIPLIASSIMSKKIALGSDIIVLDVKYGKGAFLTKKEEAKKLAKTMVQIGKEMDKKTAALLTNIDQPLGANIGNSLEVEEAIEVLQGKGNKEVKKLVTVLTKEFLKLSDINLNEKSAEEIVEENLKNNKAYNKFKEFIKAQGGQNIKFPKARFKYQMISNYNGFISELDALEIARAVLLLGGGRIEKDDKIDLTVGVKLIKKIGGRVLRGDILAEIYYNDENKFQEALKYVEKAFKISDEKCPEIILLDQIIR